MGKCIRADLGKDMDGQTRLHRFRYHLARGFIQAGDRVLDVGSGAGYGADLYSDVASKVTGIELEQSEVTAAQERYPQVEFVCGNIEDVDLPLCDISSAFEIIEHLYKPKDFVDKLKSVTSKYIIFSVPIGEHLLPNEQTVDGDSCHHSVFANGDELMNMFVDENWKEFFRLQLGVTFLGIVYNNNL